MLDLGERCLGIMSRPGNLAEQAVNTQGVELDGQTIRELEGSFEHLLGQIQTILFEIEIAQEQMCVDDREIVPLIASCNDSLEECLGFGELTTSDQTPPGRIHFNELQGQAADLACEQAAAATRPLRPLRRFLSGCSRFPSTT